MPEDFLDTQDETDRPDAGEGGIDDTRIPHAGKVLGRAASKRGLWTVIVCASGNTYTAKSVPPGIVMGPCDDPNATDVWFNINHLGQAFNVSTEVPDILR